MPRTCGLGTPGATRSSRWTAGAALFGPDEIETVVRLRRELDNLRAATFWSLDSDGDHAEALAIVAALASMASFDRSSGLSGWADQAVAYVGETTPGQAAAVLGAASWCAMDRGDVDTARTRALAALDGVHEPDCTEPAQTIVLLGVQGMYTGDSSHIAAMMDHIDRFADEQSSLYVQSVLCSSFSSLAAVLARARPACRGVRVPRTGARRAVRQSDCTRQTCTSPSGWRSKRTLRLHPSCTSNASRCRRRVRAARCTRTRSAVRRGSRVDLDDYRRAAELIAAAIEYADRVGDHPSLGNALDESAFVLCAAGRTAGGLVFIGHAGASSLSSYVTADDTNHATHVVEEARRELGDEACDAALRRGAILSERELVILALAELDAVRRDEPPA